MPCDLSRCSWRIIVGGGCFRPVSRELKLLAGVVRPQLAGAPEEGVRGAGVGRAAASVPEDVRELEAAVGVLLLLAVHAAVEARLHLVAGAGAAEAGAAGAGATEELVGARGVAGCARELAGARAAVGVV